jgi:hypothetical protein
MQGVNRMALITAGKEQVCMDNIGLQRFCISGKNNYFDFLCLEALEVEADRLLEGNSASFGV